MYLAEFDNGLETLAILRCSQGYEDSTSSEEADLIVFRSVGLVIQQEPLSLRERESTKHRHDQKIE